MMLLIADVQMSPWRLSHLGQTSTGTWSCELTRPYDSDSWQVAIARGLPTWRQAIRAARDIACKSPTIVHSSAHVRALNALSTEDL